MLTVLAIEVEWLVLLHYRSRSRVDCLLHLASLPDNSVVRREGEYAELIRSALASDTSSWEDPYDVVVPDQSDPRSVQEVEDFRSGTVGSSSRLEVAKYHRLRPVHTVLRSFPTHHLSLLPTSSYLVVVPSRPIRRLNFPNNSQRFQVQSS